MSELKRKLNSLEKGFLSYKAKIRKGILNIPSLHTDVLFSLKGIPVNSIIEIYGCASSGKTTLIKRIVEDVKSLNFIPIVFDTYYRFDCSSKNIIVCYTNRTKEIISFILKYLKENNNYLFVIDSIAGLDDPIYFINNIQKIISSMKNRSNLFIYTNEMRCKIKKKKLLSYGGRELKYYSNIRIKLHKTKHLLEMKCIKNTYGKCNSLEIKI